MSPPAARVISPRRRSDLEGAPHCEFISPDGRPRPVLRRVKSGREHQRGGGASGPGPAPRSGRPAARPAHHRSTRQSVGPRRARRRLRGRRCGPFFWRFAYAIGSICTSGSCRPPGSGTTATVCSDADSTEIRTSPLSRALARRDAAGRRNDRPPRGRRTPVSGRLHSSHTASVSPIRTPPRGSAPYSFALTEP